MGSLCTVPFAAPLNHCKFVVKANVQQLGRKGAVQVHQLWSAISATEGSVNLELLQIMAATCLIQLAVSVSAALAPAPNLVWFSASECYVQYLMTGKFAASRLIQETLLTPTAWADDGQVPLGPTTAHLQRF